MTQNHKDNSWAYIWLAVLIGGAILYFLLAPSNPGYVTVKYRSDKVDISASNFQPLNKSDSTVKGAWYDNGNKYMIIKLGSTYYHYCGIPSGIWDDLMAASSPYEYYQGSVKGNFDCRVNHVPAY